MPRRHPSTDVKLTEAQQRLVEENIGLAWEFTNQYSRTQPNTVERDEYLSYAYEGLCRAARTFDPSRGLKFSTFAYTWMNRAVKQRHRGKLIVIKAASKRSSATEAAYRRAVNLKFRSFDDANQSALAVHDEPYDDTPSTDEQLDRILSQIDARARSVIERIWIEGHTYRSIGIDMGVSPQRVRQISLRGFKKMQTRIAEASHGL